MPALAVLDPLTVTTSDPAGSPSVVFSGLVLGREVVIAADRPVPVAPLNHLLSLLDEQWDVRRRRSDLARVSNRPDVMVAVSPVTLLLVRHAVTALRLSERARLRPDSGQAVLDLRHGRVGLDPTAAGYAVRLAPAVAVDVLTDFCLSSSGVLTGSVRVGDTVRGFGDVVPVWLRQVAREGERGTAAMSHQT